MLLLVRAAPANHGHGTKLTAIAVSVGEARAGIPIRVVADSGERTIGSSSSVRPAGRPVDVVLLRGGGSIL